MTGGISLGAAQQLYYLRVGVVGRASPSRQAIFRAAAQVATRQISQAPIAPLRPRVRGGFSRLVGPALGLPRSSAKEAHSRVARRCLDDDGQSSKARDPLTDDKLPGAPEPGVARINTTDEAALSPVSSPEDGYPDHVLVLHRPRLGILGLDGQPAMCEYHIVGTSRWSQHSCEDVRQVIRRVRPDAIMIQLCSDSTCRKTAVESMMEEARKAEISTGMIAIISLIFLCFAVGQRYMVELTEGRAEDEFRVAQEEACAIGAKVHHGDRPFHITKIRCWAALSLREKADVLPLAALLYLLGKMTVLDSQLMGGRAQMAEKIVARAKAIVEVVVKAEAKAKAMVKAHNAPSTLHEPQQPHMTGEDIAIMNIVWVMFPSLVKPLIYERDCCMVNQLRSLSGSGPAFKVVAVVDKVHLTGIQKNWENEDIDVQELMQVPVPKPWSEQLGWVSLMAVASCIVTAEVLLLMWSRYAWATR